MKKHLPVFKSFLKKNECSLSIFSLILKKKSICLIIAFLFAASNVSAQLQANIQASVTSGVAPLAVFFDARNTNDPSAPSRKEKLLDLSYTWDFGDPNSGNWTYGASGQSKNIESGFLAGHIYETPGTYTVTLTVNNGTQMHQTTTVIGVMDPDSYWGGNRTVCVSASGNFAGCPAGASHVIGNDFDSITKAPGAASDFRILFRRGDTFISDLALTLQSTGVNMIGAYGTGNKPIITLKGAHELINAPQQPNSNWRIADLNVIGNDQIDDKFFDEGGKKIKNLLFLRNDITNMIIAFKISVQGRTPVTDMNDLISIISCSSLSAGPNSAADLYGGTERGLFLGNNFGDKDGAQHVLRWPYMDGVIMAHNSLGRKLGQTQHVIKIHNDLNPSATAATLCTKEFIVSDNLIEGSPGNQIDCDFGVNSNRGQECVETFIVERNHFKTNLSNFSSTKTLLQITGGWASVRNNIFDLSNSTLTDGIAGVRLFNKVPVQAVDPHNVRIYNNTFFSKNNQTFTRAISIDSDSTLNTKIKNNLLYTPNSTQIMPVQLNGHSADTAKNIKVSTNPFVSANPVVAGDFMLKAGSSAINYGTTVPVYDDFLYTARKGMNGLPDAGAFEYAAPTSIFQVDNVTGVHIYPNPARDKFMIEVVDNSMKNIQITLLNLYGSIIEDTMMNGISSKEIDISQLPRAIYILKIHSETGEQIIKLQKVN